MANDLRLCWHPDFGAVICMEADDEDSISDVLSSCPFTEGLTSDDVRFVKRRRRFWRSRLVGRVRRILKRVRE